MISPLQLREFYLEKLFMEVNDQFRPRDDSPVEDAVECTLSTEVAKHPDKLDFMVLTRVSLLPKADAANTRFHRLEVSIRGFFCLPEGTPEDVVKQLVPFNCVAILYGLARGFVSQATALTEHGTETLPTVNLLAALQPDSPPPDQAEAEAPVEQ